MTLLKRLLNVGRCRGIEKTKPLNTAHDAVQLRNVLNTSD